MKLIELLKSRLFAWELRCIATLDGLLRSKISNQSRSLQPFVGKALKGGPVSKQQFVHQLSNKGRPPSRLCAIVTHSVISVVVRSSMPIVTESSPNEVSEIFNASHRVPRVVDVNQFHFHQFSTFSTGRVANAVMCRRGRCGGWFSFKTK